MRPFSAPSNARKGWLMARSANDIRPSTIHADVTSRPTRRAVAFDAPDARVWVKSSRWFNAGMAGSFGFIVLSEATDGQATKGSINRFPQLRWTEHPRSNGASCKAKRFELQS